MENGDGTKSCASARLRAESGDWHRLDFSLTPTTAETAGRFAVKLTQPGSAVLGHAMLQPGSWGRFQGLPVRRDVAESLVAQGLTVLRYGGSMVNAAEYRWKKMIGRATAGRRTAAPGIPTQPMVGELSTSSTFADAAGFLAVPDFNMDESPQDMADFVEYMNGPADSPWGKRRSRPPAAPSRIA